MLKSSDGEHHFLIPDSRIKHTVFKILNTLLVVAFV